MLVPMLSISILVPNHLDASGLIREVLLEKPAVYIEAWPLRNPKCVSTHLALPVIWKAPGPDFFILLVNFPYLMHWDLNHLWISEPVRPICSAIQQGVFSGHVNIVSIFLCVDFRMFLDNVYDRPALAHTSCSTPFLHILSTTLSAQLGLNRAVETLH